MQVIVNGLLVGGIYSLVAVGLNIIYGAMDIVNFAHGEFLMLAMYMAYWLFTLLGLDPLISLPLCAATLFIIGLAVQAGLIDRVLKAPMSSQIFITFGLLLFLRNIVLMVWKPDYRTIKVPYGGEVLILGPVRLPYTSLISFGIALATSVLLYIFLERTDLGTALRATSQDREAAALMGVNVHRMYMLAFGIGSACVGIAGALVATYYPIFPEVGVIFGLVAFVVCVLGGLGNYVGAFVGGLIIGVAEMLGGYWISPAYKHAVSFVIFIIILLVKPEGLFGK